MSALKPCPFCGGEGRIGFIRDGAQVSCRRCHASVIAFSPDAQNSAIAAWNRRAGDDEVEKLRAELAAAREDAHLMALALVGQTPDANTQDGAHAIATQAAIDGAVARHLTRTALGDTP